MKQLWEYFATYIYLPRLLDRDVLLATIKSGVFTKDFFGYATGAKADGGYVGLTFGTTPPGVYYDDTSVIVRPEVAAEHLSEQLRGPTIKEGEANPIGVGAGPGVERGTGEVTQPVVKAPTRFYGTVILNPLRLSSEAGDVGREIVQHLEALLGSNVSVTLEIDATSPDGFPDNVVRTVTENARTLKFKAFGFESE